MSQPVSEPSFEDAQWSRLIAATERLATTRSMEEVVQVLRDNARAIVDAEGIAVVIRDDDKCFYAAEDAVASLWAGQRFPVETCVSGWAMIHRETVVIPDVRLDPRIPQDAYAPTFVRSLAMAPIGSPEPVAALGAYWSDVHLPSARAVARLQALARSAAIALENVRLLETVRQTEGRYRDLAASLEVRVEERTTELLRTQEALRQSQKLEAMGQLTGGVAHDFNNLLTPIMGSLDLLQRRDIGGEREKRLIGGAMEAAERAKALVQRLLAFARRQPLTKTPVDLGAMLGEMRGLIETTVGHQVALTLDIDPDLPIALADQNQLEMALLNLALNSRDAMPAGGTLIVSAQRDRVEADGPAGLPPGDYVLLAVADDGQGMDEETRTRAIEPFYSTKGVGKGTGLGLSMVHGLIAQLGGGLALTSAPGRGTCVFLWLPISGETAPAVRVDHRDSGKALGSGRVLLVDDEDLVRASTADMLNDLGFDVIEARSGAEALERLRTGPSIDLLVTDYIMPAMTGAELAKAVQATHPNLPILVVSGYTDAVGLPTDLPRLEKPFRQADLAASLQRTREAAASS